MHEIIPISYPDISITYRNIMIIITLLMKMKMLAYLYVWLKHDETRYNEHILIYSCLKIRVVSVNMRPFYTIFFIRREICRSWEATLVSFHTLHTHDLVGFATPFSIFFIWLHVYHKIKVSQLENSKIPDTERVLNRSNTTRLLTSPIMAWLRCVKSLPSIFNCTCALRRLPFRSWIWLNYCKFGL